MTINNKNKNPNLKNLKISLLRNNKSVKLLKNIINHKITIKLNKLIIQVNQLILLLKLVKNNNLNKIHNSKFNNSNNNLNNNNNNKLSNNLNKKQCHKYKHYN